MYVCVLQILIYNKMHIRNNKGYELEDKNILYGTLTLLSQGD